MGGACGAYLFMGGACEHAELRNYNYCEHTHMCINIQCHIIKVGHMVKWVAKMTNVMTCQYYVH